MKDARGVEVQEGATAIVIKTWAQQKSGGDIVIARIDEEQKAIYFHNPVTGRENKVNQKELYIVPVTP